MLSETPGRVVVAISPDHAGELISMARKYDLAITKLGTTGGTSLTVNDAVIPLDELRTAYTQTIPKLFG